MILECTGMNQNDTRMDHSVPCSAQLCFIQCQSGALGHSSTFHSFVYLVTFWNGGGGYSLAVPIRVCAAQRGHDFGTPDLERVSIFETFSKWGVILQMHQSFKIPVAILNYS